MRPAGSIQGLQVRSIPRKLLLLHATLFLVLAGAILVFDSLLERQLHHFLEEREKATKRIVGKFVNLRMQSLQVHVDDYSRWDDFMDFVSSRSPAWAQYNIETSITAFGVDAAWVLTPEGRTIYATANPAGIFLPCPPSDPELLRQKLMDQPFLHYFTMVAGRLLEIRSAPIQPTAR